MIDIMVLELGFGSNGSCFTLSLQMPLESSLNNKKPVTKKA